MIGQNGSGKSTLLRILAGLDEPDSAPAVRRRGMVASYLPQLVGPDPRTPIEICHAARPDIARVERELEECATRAGEPRGGRRHGRHAAGDQPAGAPASRSTTSSAATPSTGTVRGHLETLGLTDDEVERPHAELSGGKRKLVALAACLAQEPDLLLLDEPETHLDAVRRSGLEELVRRVPRGGRHGVARPLPARRDGRPRSPSSTAASSACGRATTPPTRPPASSSSSSRRPRSPRSRRRSPASRRRSGATSSGRAWSTTAATRSEPATPQRRIERMDKVERPVHRAAQDRARAAKRRARRKARRRAARRHGRVRRRSGAASTSTSRSSAASGSASSAETAAGRASS